MRRVVFDRERCKGCELCVRVCPVEIIRMVEGFNRAGYHPAYVPEDDLDRCISCGLCATMCPDLVIEVFRPRRTQGGEVPAGG